MNIPVSVILLAAGEGRRMCSAAPKPMLPLSGIPMMSHILKSAKPLQSEGVPLAVVGAGAQAVRAHYGERLSYCVQDVQNGSGAALLAALPEIRVQKGRVLVLSCDVPLLGEETLQALTMLDCDAAFLTAKLEDPAGFARVTRDRDGRVLGIAEEEALTDAEKGLREVRVSAYCFSAEQLAEVLTFLHGKENLSMSDVVEGFLKAGLRVQAMPVKPEEALTVNDRVQLSEAAAALRRRINHAHMRAGVTMIDPEHTYIDIGVKIGRDSTIYPGVVLEGNTVIGEGTTLYPACRIVDSRIGSRCAAQGVVAKDAVVGDDVTLGPYVNLRPGANLANRCKVGNYIEVKNANVGEGSKLPHLSYIGDGDVGRHVNLGCGTVFVNYDGYKKHRTVIGDNAFIGCHTSLVAPVTVGEGAFTAAGSVITEEVPAGALAVARAKQVNKLEYVKRLKIKRGEIKE